MNNNNNVRGFVLKTENPESVHKPLICKTFIRGKLDFIKRKGIIINLGHPLYI